MGTMVGLMVTSKRVYTKGELQSQGPVVSPMQMHASTGGPPTLAGSLVQSPAGSLLLSSGSWFAQDFVCVLQVCSLSFPQSCGSPIIKSHWPSQIPWGFPVPLSDFQAGKTDVGLRTFLTVGELL